MFTTTRSSEPRVMMYSQDGFGLGHMRRTTSIATQFARVRSDAALMTLADSRLGQFFENSVNHDYIKLPSIVKLGPGNWRSVSMPMPFADVHVMRRELIRSAALSFQPDILLVDHMPHGAMGELLPTLEALRGSGTRVVLGLRDILDAPEIVRNRWREEGAYDAIERYYDRVLVYGQREVFDLTEQYGFAPDRLRYCGYVCTPDLPRYAARARAQNLAGAEPGTKLIVAMAGGGADAYPILRALLDAMPAIQRQQRCVLVLITGPFMPAEQRRNLEARARGLPVRVRKSVSDPLSYIDAADLTIGMAGYNTTMEILRSGRRAILIPRAGPSAEQRTRTRLFAARGWIDMIDPDDLSADNVARTVLDNLGMGPLMSPPTQPNLEGLTIAVDHLISLLEPAHRENAALAMSLELLEPALAPLVA